MGEKIVKKYNLSLLIIKNLFSVYNNKTDNQITQSTTKDNCNFSSEIERMDKRKKKSQIKNSFVWNCKAR